MSVSATQFRIDLKNLLIGVKQGESYDIIKHGTIIGRLLAGDAVETPDMTISATNVRVKFKDVISHLNAGSTYHILKHKRVLAALVPADYAASTGDIEIVEDDEAYNAIPAYNVANDPAYNVANDVRGAIMDALSEDMNPVESETPASKSASDDGLDTLTMKELYSYAEMHDIEMPPRRPRFTKYDVKAFIRKTLNERAEKISAMHAFFIETPASKSASDMGTSEDIVDVFDDNENTGSNFEVELPEEDDYDRIDTLTMKELHSYAEKHGIEIPPRSRKSEVKAVIREALDKRDGHDYLDTQHDDNYDAFFADLAADEKPDRVYRGYRG